MAFDTSVLDDALARRRAKLENERQRLLETALNWLDQHAAQFGIRRAYLFGSLTQPGRFDENSDVDIAIEQIDPEQFFEAMSKFSTALRRNVDLVELSKCHFAHRIREKGILWEKTS